MLFSDLHVAAYVVFAVLLLWRASVGLPEGYWPYPLAFAVVGAVLRAVERVVKASRLERDVAYLASLDPATAEARIGSLWSAHARRVYRDRVRAEGQVERGGAVERFPYPQSERRSMDQLFWGTVTTAATLFTTLFLVARRGGWLPWVVWGIGASSVVLAGYVRRRGRERASVLEVSPFGIVAVASDGSRRMVRWGQPLTLQNQPRRRRVILATDRGETIPIGYRRLGFQRLLALTIEYGGFAAPASQPEDHPSGA